MNCSKHKRPRVLRWIIAGSALSLVVATLGFLAVVYGWTQFARTLAPLQGWHLQRPLSEFVAGDERAGYDLVAYRKQEDQVFRELDAHADGSWATQVDGRFSRFGRDSVCNPARLLDRNWNRTYVMESPNPIGGALLLHGLSDSPYSLRAMGERLHGLGYTVVGLRVPGHGHAAEPRPPPEQCRQARLHLRQQKYNAVGGARGVGQHYP